MHTILGRVATQRGLYQQHHPILGPQPGTCGAYDFTDRQPKPLPILLRHDPEIVLGEVLYLERSRSANGLIAVGVVDDNHGLDPDNVWFSAGYRCKSADGMNDRSATMFELSLLPHEGAVLAAGRCWITPGDLRDHTSGHPGHIRSMPLNLNDTWERAHTARLQSYDRRHADHLPIRDIDADRVRARQHIAAATRKAPPPPPATSHRRTLPSNWTYTMVDAE